MIHKGAIISKAYCDGTYRIVSPEETVARIKPFLPLMGITRIANVTGLDIIGIPVTMVCRPNSRSLSVSQGKGLTLAAAKASGLMESIELFHAEHMLLPLMLGSYNDLSDYLQLVNPYKLPLCRDSFYHNDFRLLWCQGQNLIDGKMIWVPHELVHTNYSLPFPTGSGCFVKSSNGLASGNHILEAISHSICEVVERDALSLWEFRSETFRRERRLDLTTVDDKFCQDILNKYEQAFIAVGVWDITSNIGIPTFICAIKEKSDDPLRLLYSTLGSGCHPNRGVALLRALTEAAQSRLTLISGGRDDKPIRSYEHGRDPEVLQRNHIELQESICQHSFRDIPTYNGKTFNDDISWELEQLRSTGIEQVIVVDLTQPIFGIPVTRVIIPRLEGTSHSPYYTPGERAQKLIENAIQGIDEQ